MLLIEQCEAAEQDLPASRSSPRTSTEDALEFARAGVYPEGIAADVSPERLRRFFTQPTEHAYRVNKQLREAIIFAAQNVIGDPPFSKLDLISCRNLLIYLEPDVQEKLIGLFHFALRKGGYLFLGNAETVGRRARPLRARLEEVAGLPPDRARGARRSISRWSPPLPHPRRTSDRGAPPAQAQDRRTGERLVLERFAPRASW